MEKCALDNKHFIFRGFTTKDFLFNRSVSGNPSVIIENQNFTTLQKCNHLAYFLCLGKLPTPAELLGDFRLDEKNNKKITVLLHCFLFEYFKHVFF